MTPEAHETLKLQMQLLAAETMAGWMAAQVRAFCMALPASKRKAQLLNIRQKLSEQQSRLAPVANRSSDQVEAILGTLLFHEAFDDLSKKLIAAIEADA